MSSNDGLTMLDAVNTASEAIVDAVTDAGGVIGEVLGVGKPSTMLVVPLEQRNEILALLKDGNEYRINACYPEQQPVGVGDYKSSLGSYKSPVIEHGDGTVWVKVDVRDAYHSEAPAAHLLITVGERAYKLTFSAAEFEALADAVQAGSARVRDEMTARELYAKARAAAQKRYDDWRNRKDAWGKRITTWWAAVNPKNKKKPDTGVERRIFAEDIPADVDLSLVPDQVKDTIPF